jgi:diacylglycerol kinase (ATP)
LKALLRAMRSRGMTAPVWLTRQRGHGEELARRALAESVETVVVCGGDGTVHDVVQALAGGAARLALAPAGRCNDFARVLGEPPGPEEAAALLEAGRARALDLARVGDFYYCTVAAVGFDAEVSRRVDQSRLPLRGQPAYLTAVVGVLAGYRPAEVRIQWEGGSFEGPILLAAVANTPTYGNAIPIAPQARADDGLLGVCLVKPAGFFRTMRLLPTLLAGAHGKLPEVSFVSSPWLEIESDRPMEIWADGEPVTMCPQRFEAAPAAIQVVGARP